MYGLLEKLSAHAPQDLRLSLRICSASAEYEIAGQPYHRHAYSYSCSYCVAGYTDYL